MTSFKFGEEAPASFYPYLKILIYLYKDFPSMYRKRHFLWKDINNNIN